MMMVRSWDSDDDDDDGDNGDDGNHDSDIEDDGGDHGDDSYGDGDIDNGRVAEVKGIKVFPLFLTNLTWINAQLALYNPKLPISCKKFANLRSESSDGFFVVDKSSQQIDNVFFSLVDILNRCIYKLQM